VEQCSVYKLAPELNSPVRQVIKEYHPHLADAKMVCLFRSGEWKNKGRTVLGKAVVAPLLWRVLTGYELVLVINKVVYGSLSNKGKTALLDHELSRFSEPVADREGNLSYSIQDHDVKEFSAVVKRHNVCFSNLQAIEADGSCQLTMFETLASNVENTEDLMQTHKPTEITEAPITVEEFDEDDDQDYEVKQQFIFDD